MVIIIWSPKGNNKPNYILLFHPRTELWLFMVNYWLHSSPNHQQPRYWLSDRYDQIYNIRHNKSQNFNVSCLVLQLSLCNVLMPVSSFTKEVNPRLAKHPLKINGLLANRELTSLVKEDTGVKLRMKMLLEQGWQVMLQLHLNDQQVYSLLRCSLYYSLMVGLELSMILSTCDNALMEDRYEIYMYMQLHYPLLHKNN